MLTFILCFVGAAWGFITLRAVRAVRLHRAYEKRVAEMVPAPMGYVRRWGRPETTLTRSHCLGAPSTVKARHTEVIVWEIDWEREA